MLSSDRSGGPLARSNRHGTIGRRLLGCIALVAIVIAAATAKWIGAADRSHHGQPLSPFRCHADFQLDSAAPATADLDRLQTDLVEALHIEPTREPIDLYLFVNAKAYIEFLHARYPQVPNRRALYVKDNGPGQVFAQWGADFAIDLRHESTHALLHGSLTYLPLWLDEGLAKYFELPRERRVAGSPYLPVVRAAAMRGAIPPLVVLEAKREFAEMGPTEYCYAWAWVHFMLDGPQEAHDELIRYLADLAQHRPAGELSDRLTQRLGNIEALVARHFSASTP